MARPVVCERVRAQVSLQLDGELSELERRMMESHLARCAECGAYERDVATLTRLLREAPLEQPRFPVVVRRSRRATLAHMQMGRAAAALAVAVVGTFGIVAQFTGGETSRSPDLQLAQAPVRYETRDELMREQLLLAGGHAYDGGSVVPI